VDTDIPVIILLSVFVVHFPSFPPYQFGNLAAALREYTRLVPPLAAGGNGGKGLQRGQINDRETSVFFVCVGIKVFVVILLLPDAQGFEVKSDGFGQMPFYKASQPDESCVLPLGQKERHHAP
jgi:hypothetical protein